MAGDIPPWGVIQASIMDSTRLDRLNSYREDLFGTLKDSEKHSCLSDEIFLGFACFSDTP